MVEGSIAIKRNQAQSSAINLNQAQSAQSSAIKEYLGIARMIEGSIAIKRNQSQ